MSSKQRLFIYERREIAILILIGFCAVGFSFTLGVHLGKRIKPVTLTPLSASVSPVEKSPEELPSTQELIQQTQNADKFLKNSVTEELHDEVVTAGVHIDQPEIVSLPEKPLNANAGAMVSDEQARFMTWIGNYPTPEKAQVFLKQTGESRSFWKSVGRHIEGYLGPFPNEPDATEAGERLKAAQLIPSFKVIRMK